MNVQRQHEAYALEYEEAALHVLRSGMYIGGAEVSAFEEEFAAYMGARYGISCGNGTDAIILALRALGIGPGDEVITVSWTFFATAESIAAVGAIPVFVDVDADTYCMDANAVEKAVTERTKAILPVLFYGNCPDLDALRRLAKKHKLHLIMDCAQAAGTKYRKERKNTLGDISCFSFFPTKNLGCDGDGGMILTDDEELFRACRALKMHGSGKDGLWTMKREYAGKCKPLPPHMPVGETKYYNYLIGYNSRLDAIQAAILRKKLTHMDEFIAGRRRNAAHYDAAFESLGIVTPLSEKNTFHSYYIYALKHEKAAEIMKRLKAADIACGTYYPVPLHLQGAFTELGYEEGDLPVTEELAKHTFAIPVFPELTEAEQKYIIETLTEIMKEIEVGQ